MIIDCYLMVQLSLTADCRGQVHQWEGTILHMKEPSGLLGQSDLNNHKMREVCMKTVEPDSTREAPGLIVKILNSTYAKADLKMVANNATIAE